jgi:Tol biopolymer transport system component
LTSRARLFGRVVVFDTSGTRIAATERYANVFGLAWRDDEVWFTAADELPLFRNTLYAMRASGKMRITVRVPGNTSLHDIAPDGTMLIARTDDRGGIAVRAPGAEGERDLSLLDGTNVADFSHDGRQMLFYEFGAGGGRLGSTYLRGTDGSPAVRLGDGVAHALSPDGRRAIVQVGDEPHFQVISTGAGESSRIARSGLTLLGARWHPDGNRIVARARRASSDARLYLLDVTGDGTTQITPDTIAVGDSGWAVSPDGAMVAVSHGNAVLLFDITGGQARNAQGLSAQSRVVGWIEGGLLISENPGAGGEVFQVDPVSGRRALWADIKPRDPAGIMNLDLNSLVTSPDGRAYGYSWHRAISDLYLVQGVS